MIDLFEELKYLETEIENKESLLSIKNEELFKNASIEQRKEIEEMFLDDDKSFLEVGKLATANLKSKMQSCFAVLEANKIVIASLKRDLETLKKLIVKLSVVSLTDFLKLIKIFCPNIQVLVTKNGMFLYLNKEKIAKLNNGDSTPLLYSDLKLNAILVKLNIFIEDFVKLYVNNRFIDLNLNVIDFYEEYKTKEQLKK